LQLSIDLIDLFLIHGLATNAFDLRRASAIWFCHHYLYLIERTAIFNVSSPFLSNPIAKPEITPGSKPRFIDQYFGHIFFFVNFVYALLGGLSFYTTLSSIFIFVCDVHLFIV